MRFLLVMGFLFLLGCGRSERAVDALNSDRDWRELDEYQGTVSREAFEGAMDRIYAPKADWRQWMVVEDGGVWVEQGDALGGERYFLRFGDAATGADEGEARAGLRGLRVVLDPGHIGGQWGPLEHRSFAVAGGPVLQEGDLTLAAARRIAARLRELGAEVLLTREVAEPVTRWRGEDFLEEAFERLGDGQADPYPLANRLFYRTAEIRARAERIAEWGGADFAVALHVNASSVADPETSMLHDGNDGHVLINGCYLADELADRSQRLELLLRLVKGYHLEEERLGVAMVKAMRDVTQLPAYGYKNDNAAALDGDGYLWARNLLANRSFDCPVVYLEPWQANGKDVYEWAAAGDYKGQKAFGGELRRSLPAVYSDFVVQGLLDRFSSKPARE